MGNRDGTVSPQGSDPGDRLLALVGKPGGPLEDASLWALEVVASSDITPTMRRIELHSPGLAELRYRAGQDLMLRVPTDAGSVTNRRYTIRSLDREREVVTCDVLLHGNGPGAQWAAAARPSDHIDAIGPRGKIWAADADAHWFFGDESAVPATLAMIEALPAEVSALATLDVASPRDQQPFLHEPRASVEMRWLPRGASPLDGLVVPSGSLQAYVNGEAHDVRELGRALVDLGLRSEQVATKSYWSRGRSNAEHGEPARDEAEA